MPKLKNRLPKKCRDRNRAFSWYKGKRVYHGIWGTEEADRNYKRFIHELTKEPPPSLPGAVSSGEFCPVQSVRAGGGTMLVSELCVEFLKYHTPRLGKTDIQNFKYAFGYIIEAFGNMSVNSITPKRMRSVRSQMVASGRLCRRTVNDFTAMLIRCFTWGCEEEYVGASVAGALKMIKPLPKGEPGTFDHPKRRNVSDEIIRRTLPFLSKTVATMVRFQRILGLRPSEVFIMVVGDIVKNADPELWFYIPGHHKTQRYYDEVDEVKIIPLGKPEQALIAQYLEGKKPEDAVFSPRTAIQERKDERRANRKTKITPSQAARDKARAENPVVQAGDFYNADSYRTAVQRAIERANRELQEGEKPIPMWSPYQLRHQAATALALAKGKDGDKLAAALLDHASVTTTRNHYIHERLEKRKELARNRIDPFADEPDDAIDLQNAENNV